MIKSKTGCVLSTVITDSDLVQLLSLFVCNPKPQKRTVEPPLIEVKRSVEALHGHMYTTRIGCPGNVTREIR